MKFLNSIKQVLVSLYQIPRSGLGSIIIVIFFCNGILGFIVEQLDPINIVINSMYLLIAFIEFLLLIGSAKWIEERMVGFRFLEFFFAVFVTVCELLGYNINADRFILPLMQFILLSIMMHNDIVQRKNEKIEEK
jgi:hypothetical protein